jgi:hypothetical protein
MSERHASIDRPGRRPGRAAWLLGKVHDLGLPLIAIIHIDPKQANGPDVNADIDHDCCGHGSANT